MSSAAIAHVLVFYRKASELENKGRLLRAAEIYGRAAEAARAVDAPENIAVVSMQERQANVLLEYVLAVDGATAISNVVAGPRAEIVALLSAAVTALERRRVAGTLLEGRCTAAEEDWDAAMCRDVGQSAAEAALHAKLVGYRTFLCVAASAFSLLRNTPFFAAQCTATQLQSFAQHVMHAADLMQQPRSHGTAAMCGEIGLAQRLSSCLAADDSGVSRLQRTGLDPCLVQLLLAAWQRLQRSGVLEARGLFPEERQLRENRAAREKYYATIDAALSAPGLRSCALAGCGAKEAHPQHFKSCAACRTVVYCRRQHQEEDWPSHKKACKAARKAAAASDGGASGASAAGAHT